MENKMAENQRYDVIIIGAGPGGIFSAYELMKGNSGLKVAVIDMGNKLDKRKCDKRNFFLHSFD